MSNKLRQIAKELNSRQKSQDRWKHTVAILAAIVAPGIAYILSQAGTAAAGNSAATGGAAVIQLKNCPGYEFLSTGGYGVLPYTIAGCLLLAGAACGLYIKTKQRRKEDY